MRYVLSVWTSMVSLITGLLAVGVYYSPVALVAWLLWHFIVKYW